MNYTDTDNNQVHEGGEGSTTNSVMTTSLNRTDLVDSSPTPSLIPDNSTEGQAADNVPLDMSKYEEFISAFEVLDQTPRYVLYPTNLSTKHIHALIISPLNFVFDGGKHNRKNAYVVFDALSDFIVYQGFRRMAWGIPFKFMAPTRTWYDMFAQAGNLSLLGVVRECIKYSQFEPLLHIRFRKHNDRDYELRYCAHVEFDKMVEVEDKLRPGKTKQQPSYKALKIYFQSEDDIKQQKRGK